MGAPMMLAGSHSSRYHRFQMYLCVLFVCEFASIVVVAASLISRLWLHYFYNLYLFLYRLGGYIYNENTKTVFVVVVVKEFRINTCMP